MKIYPSKHKIKSITDSHIDLDLNIPLAYVEVDYTKYKKEITFNDTVINDSITAIYPNQSFDDYPIIFNQFKEQKDSSELFQRIGDKYFYRPNDIISFTPQKFDYTVSIKKKIQYKTNTSYNINIACIDDVETLSLSKKLAATFSNPSYRNITPPNISINNNRIDAQSFSDITNDECNILFIENLSDEENIINDYNIFLDKNTNVWVASDFNNNYPHNNIQGSYEFKIKDTILNKNVTGSATSYFNYSELPYNPAVIYHNLFNTDMIPVVVIEHIGKGYEIISTTEITNNVSNYISLLYECIAFCHFNGYDSTDTLTQWISSNIPDYQIENKKLVKKQNYISEIDIYKYFNLNSSEMYLYSVAINDNEENYANTHNSIDLFDISTTVEFAGLSGGKLIFNKKDLDNDSYNVEPEKPIGWVSIYDGANIIYLKELHYLVETNLKNKVFFNITDDNLEVKILGFKSSTLKSNIETPIDIIINFIIADINGINKIREAEYIFYLNDSGINYDYIEDYTEELGHKLFNIRLFQSPDSIKITDMRNLGGGEKNDEGNFDLMDKGHIDGRPYRQTGTLVFTFPTKYKEYENTIQSAINKYITATDLAVILFEDKE